MLSVRAEGLERVEVYDALARRVAEAERATLDLGQLAGGTWRG